MSGEGLPRSDPHPSLAIAFEGRSRRESLAQCLDVSRTGVDVVQCVSQLNRVPFGLQDHAYRISWEVLWNARATGAPSVWRF